MDTDLHDFGRRWKGGEPLQALADEIGMAVGTLHDRFTALGYSLTLEEIRERRAQGGKRYGGTFSRMLNDRDYEHHRQQEFEKAEAVWSSLPSNAFTNSLYARQSPIVRCGT